MKVLTSNCSCGMKGCVTTYEIKQDPENERNILFCIKDDKHALESWISLSKEDYQDIVRFLRSKFGRVE